MAEKAKYYDEKSKVRTMRYQETHCERFTFWFKKGDKEKYKAFAESKGKSLSGLIIELLNREMGEG